MRVTPKNIRQCLTKAKEKGLFKPTSSHKWRWGGDRGGADRVPYHWDIRTWNADDFLASGSFWDKILFCNFKNKVNLPLCHIN